MESVAPPRAYDRSGRLAAAARTRDAILRATAGVLADAGMAGLSIDAVAARAGVAARTVYRHFDTREQLLEQFWAWMTDRVGLRHYPCTEAELRSSPRRVFEQLDREEDLIRAYLATEAMQDLRKTSEGQRREALAAALADAATGLPPEEARRARDTVQVLFSAPAWRILRDRAGLSGEEAGETVAWAIGVLLDHLRQRPRHPAPADAAAPAST